MAACGTTSYGDFLEVEVEFLGFVGVYLRFVSSPFRLSSQTGVTRAEEVFSGGVGEAISTQDREQSLTHFNASQQSST